MNFDVDAWSDQTELRATKNARDRHGSRSVASGGGEASLEMSESLFDVFETGSGSLEDLGLGGELVASEKIEASEVGAQDGPEIGLEIVTHVLHGGWHALE